MIATKYGDILLLRLRALFAWGSAEAYISIQTGSMTRFVCLLTFCRFSFLGIFLFITSGIVYHIWELYSENYILLFFRFNKKINSGLMFVDKKNPRFRFIIFLVGF